MRLPALRRLALLLPLAALAPFACSQSNTGADDAPGDEAPADDGGTASDGADATPGDADGAADAGEEPPPGPTVCDALGLPVRAWSAGPYGTRRDEIADDFEVPEHDGTTWSLRDRWSGCESYVFLPDTLRVSDADPTSLWESAADLAKLVATSPKNVHWFFVSRAATDAKADASLGAMQGRVDALLGKLAAADAAHWKERLHVVGKRAGALGGWVQGVLAGHGAGGFAVDRLQRVRGVGNLADVARFDQALQDGGKWPWKANLAFAAYEARHFDQLAKRQAHLDADGATVVPLWDGEVLSEFAEKDVALPSAAAMAGFDTLEIEIDQMCPDPDSSEFGNCGAWDYLASLTLKVDDATSRELARFITAYHRETHWIVDATPMLALLKDGGTRHLRWDFAPSWNVQPTATRVALRFSDQKKAWKPARATFLWSGGAFGSGYDALHPPVDVPIGAGTKHAEVWAIVTGHGAATNQCAEFCDHQHQLVVGGKTFLHEFKEAGSSNKCVPQVDSGMTPNQGGTWWFGRGGWCPGRQVDPWVTDVTAEATPGQPLHLEYRGLYGGKVPPDGSGDITLSSYLVEYE